jgi:nicotinate-nucleotide pyrophosphorylase (carboxylating)
LEPVVAAFLENLFVIVRDCTYLTQLEQSLRHLAGMAFAEDLPDGDVTAAVLGLAGRRSTGRIICREPVSMCGARWFAVVVDTFRECLGLPEADLHVLCHHQDGMRLEAGTELFSLSGDTAAIVALERSLLNFLGRGIGIANITHEYVALVRRFSQTTHILDTRKTLPAFRWFDKYAVLCGGGHNHRMNLSDQVLIKENHLAELGGVSEALAHVRRNLTKPVNIEIEVRDMAQLDEALAAECPLIMLDNFTPEMVARACARPRGNSLLEVSGGVTAANIGDYARHQPDRISIGALTHSVKAPDLSLLIDEE